MSFAGVVLGYVYEFSDLGFIYPSEVFARPKYFGAVCCGDYVRIAKLSLKIRGCMRGQ